MVNARQTHAKRTPNHPVIALAVSELKQTDALNSPASRRMLLKLVTRNVTNAEVGGIVFTTEIIPKNSMSKLDEKKPPKTATATWHERPLEGGIKFTNRNHPQIGPREGG